MHPVSRRGAGFIRESLIVIGFSGLAIAISWPLARDFTTVLTAQQALLSQQDALASTLGTIATSLVGVYRALGGGWEIREGQDLLPPEIKTEMRQRTQWGQLLAPSTYNLPASRQPVSAPRRPDW